MVAHVQLEEQRYRMIQMFMAHHWEFCQLILEACPYGLNVLLIFREHQKQQSMLHRFCAGAVPDCFEPFEVRAQFPGWLNSLFLSSVARLELLGP